MGPTMMMTMTIQRPKTRTASRTMTLSMAIKSRRSADSLPSSGFAASQAAAPYPSFVIVSVIRRGCRPPVHSTCMRPVDRLSRAAATPGKAAIAPSIFARHPPQLAPRTMISSARRPRLSVTNAEGSWAKPAGDAGASPLGHPATASITASPASWRPGRQRHPHCAAVRTPESPPALRPGPRSAPHTHQAPLQRGR